MLVLSQRELEGIARNISRSGELEPPLGGRKWTREDIDYAVSVLVLETGARGFRRALRGGMTRAQAGKYLLKALRNRLRTRAMRIRRIQLLDDDALDRMPARADARPRLVQKDAFDLAARVLRPLSPVERDALAERLGERRAREEPRRGDGARQVGRRARAYRWARALKSLTAVAREASLGRDEVGGLLRALAMLLGVAREA